MEGRAVRRRQKYHRAAWRERTGALICAICGCEEGDTAARVEIDHVIPLEDGGPDELWNTQPVCRDCHTVKAALRAHARHLTGRSARNEKAEPGDRPATDGAPHLVAAADGWIFWSDERIPADQVDAAALLIGRDLAEAFAA